eukprot:6473010-Lingulodinium_polyedra.AAC.1
MRARRSGVYCTIRGSRLNEQKTGSAPTATKHPCRDSSSCRRTSLRSPAVPSSASAMSSASPTGTVTKYPGS